MGSMEPMEPPSLLVEYRHFLLLCESCSLLRVKYVVDKSRYPSCERFHLRYLHVIVGMCETIFAQNKMADSHKEPEKSYLLHSKKRILTSLGGS